jgi:hypothetical protein
MSPADVAYWKEHAQLRVKVLLEEDMLGLHGAAAQRRVLKYKKDP